MLEVVAISDRVGRLHGLPMPIEGGPQVWIMEPSNRALVLGSAQRAAWFDVDRIRAMGAELARRRSGGGAVWIEGRASVAWVDVFVPRGCALWADDHVTTFVGVGRCWQRALDSLGIETDLVTAPRGEDRELARWACWAGQGWGELTLEGSKLVGLSQRRTRWGARIQGMAVLDASASIVADLVVSGAHGSAPEPEALRRAIGTADVDLGAHDLARRVADEVAIALDR